MSPLIISFLVIVLVWFWANTKTDKSEKRMKVIQDDIFKDYKDLIDSYKKTWTFDQLDIPTNERVKLKFAYEEIYVNKNSVEKTKWWGLLLFLAVACLSSLFLWQILPLVISVIAPSLLSVDRFNSLLNLLTIVIPVGYQLYLYFGSRFEKNPKDYSQIVKADMYKIEQAVIKLGVLDQDGKSLKVEHNNSLLNEEDIYINNGKVITGDVVNGKIIHGDVIVGKVIKK